MRARLAGLLLVGTLAGVASAATGADASDAAASPWRRCTNSHFGFSIGYPAGWHTARLGPARTCLYFDPRRVTIPRDSDFTGAAIEVLPAAQQPFAYVVKGTADKRFARVVARRATRLAGRRAVMLETVATGEGLYARGTEARTYVIDRAGDAFIVQTTSVGGDFAARKAVLDRAVRTLRFFAPRA